MNIEEADLLDGYASGILSERDKMQIEERMNIDASFKERVEAHVLIVRALKEYEERKSLKKTLDTIHNELDISTHLNAQKSKQSYRLQSYLPTIAVAASVALICVVGAFFMFISYDKGKQADYLELRKNVDKLRKSQTQILENIKKDKANNISPGKYSGSGFLISSNGYVVTAYHVVKSADSIYIENEKFGRLKTRLVHADVANDIALLMIADNQLSKNIVMPVIRKVEGNIGESVYTLGFPREDIVYGEGSISAASGYEQNENSYQVSIPLNPGNSGGPMIDQQGAVVGIISGIQTETRGAAFAIKSSVLLETIQNIPVDSLTTPVSLYNKNQWRNMTRVNQIKKWRDFVFVVKVYKGN
ncbi:MAG: serine protease [Cytophagia bacterium]|nr:serine protease [Cytophagia bacterium]NBW35587.1 serine protease [Cytophagia bacterium]